VSIVLQGIHKSYAGHSVLRDVDLDIASGELFVLLGPSGSGKSTLLRIIAGLSSLNAGRVLLHGRDVTGVAPRDRNVGFVFQNYALFRHMTVADNVEFPLRVRKVPKDSRQRRREALLELVGLSGYAHRRPGQLSGGQQQRVALARALAQEPPVLLLDEPFGALDARIRVELRHTIRRIQRELGLSMVFVTHDQEEAFALGDRVGVLEAGRLLEVGAPSTLYLHPRSDFVATFLGAANVLVGEAGRSSVRLGPVEVPLGPEASAPPGTRVRVLIRPEDVELDRVSASTRLGSGIVEEAVFAGSFERLRLRLPALPGVRAVAPATPFGADFYWIDALRPQHEAQRLPLEVGNEVYVGVRRLHVVAPGQLRFQVSTTATSAARVFAVDLAQQASAELEGAEGEFDLAILGLEGSEPLDPSDLPGAEVSHLLFVREPAAVPQRLLVCVAIGEPGKSDIWFAERLAWRLGAEVTVLTVVPDLDGAEPPPHVRRFLDAAVRTVSARGVKATAKVRSGPPRREILAELTEGGHDLLVVGAPLPDAGAPPRLDGLVARLLAVPLPCPLLVVRAPRESSPQLVTFERSVP
jgi:sulfate/thiosulfate transport system ATP-binding protein